MSVEDAAMTKAILANLASNLALPRDRVSIDVVLGQVTLFGNLDHAFQIDAAADSAWLAPGVTSLINQITVKLRPAKLKPTEEDEGVSMADLSLESLEPSEPPNRQHVDLVAATLASGMIAARTVSGVEEALLLYYKVRHALQSHGGIGVE